MLEEEKEPRLLVKLQVLDIIVEQSHASTASLKRAIKETQSLSELEALKEELIKLNKDFLGPFVPLIDQQMRKIRKKE